MTAWQQIAPADTGAVIAFLHGAKPPPGIIRIPTAADVAPAVRQARGEHTQTWLGAKAGLNYRTVSNVESDRGGSGPTVGTLTKIAAALGYDLALIPRGDA